MKNKKIDKLYAADGKNSALSDRSRRSVRSYSATETHKRRKAASHTNFALIFMLVLLAALAIVALSVILSKSWSGQPVSTQNTLNTSPYESQPSVTPPMDIPEGLRCTYVSLPLSAVREGYLVLINRDHPLPKDYKPELMSVNKNAGPYILWDTFELEPETLQQLNRMTQDFYEATGCKKVLINSTYRSFEDQQAVFEQYGPKTAIEPGCSEHHTGLAIDMQIYDPKYGNNKKAWYFYEYEDAAWLEDHFADYGFILRYPEDKTLLTQIPTYEPWHYRYIGTPHTYIIGQREECFEEYISYLQTLSFEGTRLWWNGENAAEITYKTVVHTGYVIYYVPALTDTTEIPILEGSLSYSISGDNAGGFIVTCRF